jgi:glycosyltransferase involved in cell wall biosynthesis
MNSRLISIIIPAKNRRELLGLTIKNILNQSYKNFEIIIVDDHSSDDSEEFVKSLLIKEIKFVSNKGIGPGAARNTGLKMATGEYIKFFDSDDLMTQNLLDNQLQTLQSTPADIVYSPFFMARLNTNENWELTDSIIQFEPIPSQESVNQWMMRGFNIPIPCFLFKKSFLDKVGNWREDIISSEDWDYLWRIGLQSPKMAHSNQSAFLYRMHQKQTMLEYTSSSDRDRDRLKCMFNVRKQEDPAHRFTFRDRLIFDAFLLNYLIRDRNFENFPAEFKELNTIKTRMALTLFKIDQKIGRIKTGTSWPPMRGALNSKEKFEEYMKLIVS